MIKIIRYLIARHGNGRGSDRWIIDQLDASRDFFGGCGAESRAEPLNIEPCQSMG